MKPTTGEKIAKQSDRAVVEYGIREANILHLQTAFDNVATAVPVRDVRKSIYVQGSRTDIHAFATTAEFLAMSRSVLADPRGRFFSDLDSEKAQAICVVGCAAAVTLFGFEDPLQSTVKIGSMPFRVVGVLENPYGLKVAGYDIESQIFLPLRAADAFFGKTSRSASAGSFENVKVEADLLYVRVRDVGQIGNTAARLRTYLAETHPEADVEVQVPYELLRQKEAQQRIWAIVLGAIAAISLLVGGIGIMNIMMANVYERTREIGTRRALGAKKRDILIQFLMESLLLTVLGGLLGIGLGAGLAQAVTAYGGMSTVVTHASMGLAMGISTAVGAVFGTYPAWTAANLDPILALRKE